MTGSEQVTLLQTWQYNGSQASKLVAAVLAIRNLMVEE